MTAGDALVCPSCGADHPADERFCASCGMPLVFAQRPDPDTPVSEARERARKVKPQFTEGELVRVAGAQHIVEAEFIQGLLLEEGIPSMIKRNQGFDVPDLLAAGPRDILVPASAAATAREVLMQAELVGPPTPAAAIRTPSRLFAGLLLAVVVVGIVAWLGTELFA